MALSKEELGETLVEAARDQNLAAVERYLAFGADVNYANRQGRDTALHWAAARNNKALVILLLEHGADRQLKQGSGFTAQEIAEKHGYLDLSFFIREWKRGLNEVVIRRSSFDGRFTELIETFNFASRTRVMAIYDLGVKTYGAPTKQGFDEIRDKRDLESAYDEYAKNGGTLPRAVIYHAPDERKKEPLPVARRWPSVRKS